MAQVFSPPLPLLSQPLAFSRWQLLPSGLAQHQLEASIGLAHPRRLQQLGPLLTGKSLQQGIGLGSDLFLQGGLLKRRFFCGRLSHVGFGGQLLALEGLGIQGRRGEGGGNCRGHPSGGWRC